MTEEVIVPYWLDEEEWTKSKLDIDMIQNIHLNDSLRPSIKEWRVYFKWLTEIVGYPAKEVALIKAQKSRHRRINVRICMFLHFHRAGIPVEQIVAGNFASPAGWRKQDRKAWKKAAFVYVPSVDKCVDWWCSADAEVCINRAHVTTFPL